MLTRRFNSIFRRLPIKRSLTESSDDAINSTMIFLHPTALRAEKIFEIFHSTSRFLRLFTDRFRATSVVLSRSQLYRKIKDFIETIKMRKFIVLVLPLTHRACFGQRLEWCNFRTLLSELIWMGQRKKSHGNIAQRLENT